MLRADNLGLDNLSGCLVSGLSLPQRSLIVGSSLSRGGACEISTIHTSDEPALSLCTACLGSHIVDIFRVHSFSMKTFWSLALTVFLPLPLLQCFLSQKCRGCVVDVFPGVGEDFYFLSSRHKG